jgi:nucleoside-diphosphate-sugar epimerase
MSGSLVFLTGATGHIGFKVLQDLLQAGYRVRIAVRSEAKEQVILTNKKFLEINAPASQYEFVIVKDLTEPGAYNKAVQGVDYVIHLASPITTGGEFTTEEYHEYFIKPAVKGTLSILDAAATASSVKRVVITSSVVAIIPFKNFATRDMLDDEIYNAESRTEVDEGPYTNEFEAYSASKAASLKAAEDWIKENKTSFDVVFIHPSYVEGRDDLVKTPEAAISGTNAVILGAVLGKKNPTPVSGVSVHNEDVARLHVEALKPSIPAGSYIANSEGLAGTQWEKINDIVARAFPEAIEKGIIPNNGKFLSFKNHVDSSKTEKTFGWKLQDFESQVKSVVGHYIELVEATKA